MDGTRRLFRYCVKIIIVHFNYLEIILLDCHIQNNYHTIVSKKNNNQDLDVYARMVDDTKEDPFEVSPGDKTVYVKQITWCYSVVYFTG